MRWHLMESNYLIQPYGAIACVGRRLGTAAVFGWLVSAANKTFKDSCCGDGDAVTLCDLVGRARAEQSDAVSEMKSFEHSESSKCSAE